MYFVKPVVSVGVAAGMSMEVFLHPVNTRKDKSKKLVALIVVSTGFFWKNIISGKIKYVILLRKCFPKNKRKHLFALIKGHSVFLKVKIEICG